MLLKCLYCKGCHELPLKENCSKQWGIFRSAKIMVRSSHLNNTLGSACKLTYYEIQNEILDCALQLFRKQVILELVRVII